MAASRTIATQVEPASLLSLRPEWGQEREGQRRSQAEWEARGFNEGEMERRDEKGGKLKPVKESMGADQE